MSNLLWVLGVLHFPCQYSHTSVSYTHLDVYKRQVYYRLPGFVAVISLVGQVAGSIAAVSGYFGFIPSFTLTLPGIAGIILSIGMGVDANIITAERIKRCV